MRLKRPNPAHRHHLLVSLIENGSAASGNSSIVAEGQPEQHRLECPRLQRVIVLHVPPIWDAAPSGRQFDMMRRHDFGDDRQSSGLPGGQQFQPTSFIP